MSLKIAILSPMIVGLGKTPETYTSQQISLARSWAESGHHVDVITSQKVGIREALRHPRITVFIKPSLWIGGRNGIPFFLLGGWSNLREGQYDIILSSEHYQPATALACLLSRNVVIYQGQNTDGSTSLNKFIFRFLEYTICRLVRWRYFYAIAKTNKAKAFLRDRGVNRCSVIPCGYNPERFPWPKASERSSFRSRLKIASDSEVWVYAGNLLKRRDLPTAIRAFIEYRKKHSKAIFLVVGKGPEYQSLKILATEERNAGAIRFLGELNWRDLWTVYSSSDVFVFPTKYEIYGMVLLEALGSGVPFVSTPCPAALDILERCPQAGTVFEPGNERELVTKVEDLLNYQNENEKQQIKSFLQTMTWHSVSKRIIEEISRHTVLS